MDLTHHFLLSMPQMQDKYFKQSIIYILEHDAVGASGVIINQTLDMNLSAIFEQLDINAEDEQIGKEQIYLGGPVDRQHGLVLHFPEYTFDSTRKFTGGVSLSSSLDVLKALAAGEEPVSRLVLLGHAGWGPGQLEEEIADNAWLSCEASLDIIFNTPAKQMRGAVSQLMGFNIDSMVGQHGHA